MQSVMMWVAQQHSGVVVTSVTSQQEVQKIHLPVWSQHVLPVQVLSGNAGFLPQSKVMHFG